MAITFLQKNDSQKVAKMEKTKDIEMLKKLLS